MTLMAFVDGFTYKVRRNGEVRIPTEPAHGAREDDTETLCGISLSELKPANQQWLHKGMGSCTKCNDTYEHREDVVK